MRFFSTIRRSGKIIAVLGTVIIFFIIGLFPLSRYSNVQAQPIAELELPDNPGVFQAGEEIEYDVTFLSIRLGRIIMKVDSMEVVDGKNVWLAHAYIDSREGIPFVSLHTVFESHIDEAGGYSHYFIASEKDHDGSWKYSKYLFDYPKQVITIEDGKEGKVWRTLTYPAPTKYNEGLSLFFYARCNAMYKKYVSVPTIVNDDTAHTFINFLGETESQNIDAVDYPVDCRHFVGKATWTGIYGLTGKFEGWFSNDDASIPIAAKLNLYVGSVWVQLVKWNRPGWNPPRANN